MRIPIEDDFGNFDFDSFKFSNNEQYEEVIYDNVIRDSELVEVIETSYKDVDYKGEYSKQYKKYYKNTEEKEIDNKNDIRGKIIVYSRLANENGTLISSAKINLYKLNGLSPQYVDSQLTNSQGYVEFNNLERGSYRVIAIVDRKYFEKPTYIDWNEVNIDDDLLESTITVVERIRSTFRK